MKSAAFYIQKRIKTRAVGPARSASYSLVNECNKLNIVSTNVQPVTDCLDQLVKKDRLVSALSSNVD